MPCNDSSSGLNILIDHDDKLCSFEFAKITCSGAIDGGTGLNDYCKGKTLLAILDLDFFMLRTVLNVALDEEKSFILCLELDALKAGISQYLGIDHPNVDRERCLISSIEYTDEHVEICEVILPPKELPKITHCSKAD